MFDWLKKRVSRPSPLELWSVSVGPDAIETSDGEGKTRAIPFDDLREIVVATDDSGPWGADVVFLLLGDRDAPSVVFPLEAQGQESFLDWLEAREGYDPDQLVRAMGSTNLERYTIYKRPVAQPE